MSYSLVKSMANISLGFKVKERFNKFMEEMDKLVELFSTTTGMITGSYIPNDDDFDYGFDDDSSDYDDSDLEEEAEEAEEGLVTSSEDLNCHWEYNSNFCSGIPGMVSDENGFRSIIINSFDFEKGEISYRQLKELFSNKFSYPRWSELIKNAEATGMDEVIISKLKKQEGRLLTGLIKLVSMDEGELLEFINFKKQDDGYEMEVNISTSTLKQKESQLVMRAPFRTQEYGRKDVLPDLKFNEFRLGLGELLVAFAELDSVIAVNADTREELDCEFKELTSQREEGAGLSLKTLELLYNKKKQKKLVIPLSDGNEWFKITLKFGVKEHLVEHFKKYLAAIKVWDGYWKDDGRHDYNMRTVEQNKLNKCLNHLTNEYDPVLNNLETMISFFAEEALDEVKVRRLVDSMEDSEEKRAMQEVLKRKKEGGKSFSVVTMAKEVKNISEIKVEQGNVCTVQFLGRGMNYEELDNVEFLVNRHLADSAAPCKYSVSRV